jgi:hypothetical protein
MNSKKIRSLTVLLFLAASCLAACSENPDDNSSASMGESGSGIVHGRSVGGRGQIGKSVVALVAQTQAGQALCTGSIVSEDTILTAAHCVDHDPRELAVVFGSRVRGVKPENLRKAVSFVQNPRWKKSDEASASFEMGSDETDFNDELSIARSRSVGRSGARSDESGEGLGDSTGTSRGAKNGAMNKGRGDLALVHFEGGLPAGYQPVELAVRGQTLEENMSVTLVGYGVTDGVASTGSGVLRETKTTLIGKRSSSEFVTDGKQSSVCFGDSGGPAFIEDGGHFLQIGVASSVMNQACNEASVHTSVIGYGSWIKSASARLRKGDSSGEGKVHSRRRRAPPSEAATTDEDRLGSD